MRDSDIMALPPAVRVAVIDVDVRAPASDWAAQLGAVAAALSRGLSVRANLLSALSADPSQCQLAGAKLADAGCGALVLCCADAVGDTEDALEAAVEALLWVDVAGETMLSRLALRVPHSAEGARVAAAAASRLRVSGFDVDASGRAAPPPSALLAALVAAGADIGGRGAAACAAAEAALTAGGGRH